MDEAKKVLKDSVSWCSDIYQTAEGADGIVLVTEWREFRLPNWEMIKKLLNKPLIFDGRNIYDEAQLRKEGFNYYGIGVKNMEDMALVNDYNSNLI
jgi:UDPglucose 6-dehydrogenase